VTALVAGLGNGHRGDDAIGLAVARRVATLVPPDVEVLEIDDPSDLLDLWAHHDPVVVVDAMRSHARIGTVVAFDPVAVPLPSPGWAAGGTHALGLAAVIELGRALGRLPEHLVVVGVEVADTQPSTSMSSHVATEVGSATEAVLEALRADRR
jgi:hydrogenase maturation protease